MPNRRVCCWETDVEINHAVSLHVAMLACFLATGGGGLGLFTAIHRAQSCFEAVHQKLNEAGITLYSQHNDSAGNILYPKATSDASLRQVDPQCRGLG